MKCEQSNCDHRHINAFDKRHKHTLTHGRTNEKKDNELLYIYMAKILMTAARNIMVLEMN